ncbi:hypothetical protein ROS217_11131 [Roseovarius sp. 217]|nr:hypothetical protein ROS217_11131 [Roseovarius sp. 217]
MARFHSGPTGFWSGLENVNYCYDIITLARFSNEQSDMSYA